MLSRKSFKILSIGNSFYDDTQTYLYSILKSFGIRDIIIANISFDECSISTHLDNAINDQKVYLYRVNKNGMLSAEVGYTIKEVLNFELWDVITFQQASVDSGIKSSYEKLPELILFVKDNCLNKKVEFGWNMTWAYQQNTKHQEFNRYNKNQKFMYKAIVNTVKEVILPIKDFNYLIPTGTVIQNARTSYLEDTLTFDGYHLEILARWMVGLSLVKSLTNWDFDEMDTDLIPYAFHPYLEMAFTCVKEANLHKFQVTPFDKGYINLYEEILPYKTIKDIPYSKKNNLKLNLYLPPNYSTMVIYLHGGGLTDSNKDDEDYQIFARKMASSGIAFAIVDYEKYPVAKFPSYVDNCAEAIGFIKNKLIKSCNFIICGQSAGAYIAMLLLLDEHYLNEYKMSSNDIIGWLIESGQPTTHFNVLKEKGLSNKEIVVDEAAPINYINRRTFTNVEIIAYTNDIALRKEENMLLYSYLKNLNPKEKIKLRILEGEHCLNSISPYRGEYPIILLMKEFVKKIIG